MIKDIVLISTADWSNPFWTNKQHTAISLAKKGKRILFVDSLGLRGATVSVTDSKRILKKIVKAFSPPKQVRPNIWNVSPICIPGARNKISILLNKILISINLFIYLKILGFERPVLWTYNPKTLNFIDPNAYSKIIYHCVDNISSQPHMDKNTINFFEEKLIKIADYIFVTSKSLLSKCKKWNINTYYFNNVVDINSFRLTNQRKLKLHLNDIKNIKSPRLGFVGAISSYKLNFDILIDIALKRKDWSIILIGKVGEGDPYTDVTNLKKIKNIYFLGPKKYEEVPYYMDMFDIGLLPCKINNYTKSMFPLKFFEYLAVGLPVVATKLDSLNDFSAVHYRCDDSSDFIEMIEKILLKKDCLDKDRLIKLAGKYTYDSRTEKMLNIIEKNINSH